MVRIYNSSLEVACRMAKVLVAIYPSSLSLERLICFDFILVNLKDFYLKRLVFILQYPVEMLS